MAKKELLNIEIVFKILGLLLLLESLFMFSSLLFAGYYHEPKAPIFLSGLITFVTGGMLYLLTLKIKNNTIGKREGFLIVTFTWIVISLFGSLPYLFSGTVPSFTDAFFETISGFTTTGASILHNVEGLPKYLLYWRALTNWMGGMGIIVLSVAIFPFLGIGGIQLFIADRPGTSPDKLHPRITGTAIRFLGIYLLLTGVAILLLWVGKMSFFNAICLSFATLSTGGFSTMHSSVVGFSTYSQYILVLFMFLAGTNFTLHYFALHGKINNIRKNEEFRVYVSVIAVFTIFLTLGLIIMMHKGIETAFQDALFSVVSILTTTGFVNTNYLLWPSYLWMLIFALMFFGAMSGSTGGGVKIFRHILLMKNTWAELKRSIHPSAIIPVKYGKRNVSQQIVFNVMAFFLIYFLFFALGTFVMALLGLDFKTSVGASIASLGNIGPGIGSIGPVENYAFIPTAGKWMLSFLMLIGRLELLTVLVIFSPVFWKR